jgi:hypothetical protein
VIFIQVITWGYWLWLWSLLALCCHHWYLVDIYLLIIWLSTRISFNWAASTLLMW